MSRLWMRIRCYVTSSDSSADHRGRTSQRYEYKMVEYGETVLNEAEYTDLETAIDEMAADGWRFVQALDDVLLAVFERRVNNE